MNVLLPPTVNYFTGHIESENLLTKSTTLASLDGIFADQKAFDAIPGDKIIYQVEMLPAQSADGELNFGVSHIEPGTVGNEFHMTRGHIHERQEQAEYYFGVQGEGLLLMQKNDGETVIEKVFPGSVHHIPGFVAHRLVNTGTTKLSALAVWPAIAGHNYQAIQKAGFNIRVLKDKDGYSLESS
ncbi:glucose-6-phosphate isomerase family protein [Photobacterium sp. J15]|uniref:glucose-6-phosphate isomerase family protein n=1 Tax=Photobacterium sp. J15 TaxID=265901 RepID=UPI0007E32FDD|nr:glucose-6-phosphate isomerase family protein [Photobacterium sp. J15]